jgi:hypothetical protein
MRAFFAERSTEQDSTDNKPPYPALWSMLINAWLAAVLVTFFIVRILGSSTGQRVLNSLWHAHN